MDAATQSLNTVLGGDDYVVVPKVPVFDEHDEYDDDGKIVRRFDRAALEKIAKECNRRARESGDLSPFGPGHTVSDAPEHLQPRTYGYAANFRVGTYGPKQKLGILCDFHCKREVTTPDGRKADGIEELKSYPRRSIELWLKDGFIDHIALLRRTPQRDLGLLDYAKGQSVTIPSTGNLFARPGRRSSLAAAVVRGKLCYSMESAMPLDQTPAMSDDDDRDLGPVDDDGEPIDENSPEHKMFVKHCDHYLKTKRPKVYAMDASAPSGSNTYMPGGDGDDDEDDMRGEDDLASPPKSEDEDVMKMAKQFEKAGPKVQAAQFARMVQTVQALQAERKAERKAFSKADAEAIVNGLINDGYILDEEEEVKAFAKLPVGEPRKKLEEKIRARYQKDICRVAPIARGDLLPTSRSGSAAAGKKPVSYSREQRDRAVEIAMNEKITYEAALEKVASK